MKNAIKDLLDDMIGRSISEMKILKDVFEKMDIFDASNVTEQLLFWQKIISRFDVIHFKNLSKDKLLISDQFVLLNRFTPFFEYAPPVFHEIFVLNGNEIKFNLALSEEEIKVIQTYIDENYIVETHTNPGGFSSF